MQNSHKKPPLQVLCCCNFRVEYIQLALEHKPLNLGQGFPDFAAPEHVTKALADVATSDNVLIHQYTRGFVINAANSQIPKILTQLIFQKGHPRLVAALAKLYSQLVGRQLDPLNEILVTAGAYEALYSAINGHVDEGDEVIIIEPFFDCYEPMVKTAGGVPRFIPLRLVKLHHYHTTLKLNGNQHSFQKQDSSCSSEDQSSGDWVLDDAELEGMFNSKTKIIILNTPNNPLGKVFTETELTKIAELCKKWNVLCISDEVYEWMVYKPHRHIRIGNQLSSFLPFFTHS